MILYDSEYAAKSITGEFNGKKNFELIARIREIYFETQRELRARHGNHSGVLFVKVKAHSGHDFNDMEKAMARFHANHGTGKPTAVLMTTTKGKGVSYMENQAGWHGKAPNDDEYAQAMAELAAARKAIEEG